MTLTTKRLKVLYEQSLHMIISHCVSNELGPWILGIVLLSLGLVTVKPVLTMAGAVIIAGLIFVIFKCQC